MTRAWFDRELDTVATFWRVERPDGVALGFTGHDRDLWFDGILHRAAPGMVPSAIRRTTSVEPDTAEMLGALDHAAIRADDLAAGRFDGAAVAVGLVDWETGESEALFVGAIGAIGRQGEHIMPILSRLVPSCGFLQQHCLREIVRGEQTRRHPIGGSCANAFLPAPQVLPECLSK